RAEKVICASAKAAIVDPAACSGLLKSSSSGIEQLPFSLHRAARAGNSGLAAPCVRETAGASSSSGRSLLARRFVLGEQGIELGARRRVLEAREGALLSDLLRHRDEATPSRARQGAAHTDAPHAHRGQVRD